MTLGEGHGLVSKCICHWQVAEHSHLRTTGQQLSTCNPLLGPAGPWVCIPSLGFFPVWGLWVHILCFIIKGKGQCSVQGISQGIAFVEQCRGVVRWDLKALQRELLNLLLRESKCGEDMIPRALWPEALEQSWWWTSQENCVRFRVVFPFLLSPVDWVYK